MSGSPHELHSHESDNVISETMWMNIFHTPLHIAINRGVFSIRVDV